MSEEEKNTEEEVAEESQSQTENQAEGVDSVAEEEQEEDPSLALKKQVEDLTAENAELKDKYLRKEADFQNYRKRAILEKQEAFDYANTNLLKDLLESLDNFDRTVEAASTASDAKSIADGVTMINKSLVSMLENKYNLAAYGAVGDAFDPDIHEAIGKVDEPVAEPTVKAVYLKGYKLKDRVIRHAKVMVSMPDGSVKDKEAEPAAEDKSENNEQ